MSRKTRKLIWSAPLVAVLAVAGALAIFAALSPHEASAHPADMHGAPAPVTKLAAEAAADDPDTPALEGRNAVSITWKASATTGDNASDAATHYRIDRSTDTRVWTQLEASLADADVACDSSMGAAYRCHMDTGLKPETTYYYRVFAMNAFGISAVSVDETYDDATTEPVGAPTAVPNLKATDDQEKQIDLTWDAPADDGGADILLYCIVVANPGGTLTDLALTAEAPNCKAKAAASTDDEIEISTNALETGAGIAADTEEVIIIAATDDDGQAVTSFDHLELELPDVMRLRYRIYAVNSKSGKLATIDDREISASITNTADGRTIEDAIDAGDELRKPAAPTNLRAVVKVDDGGTSNPQLRLYWTVPDGHPSAADLAKIVTGATRDIEVAQWMRTDTGNMYVPVTGSEIDCQSSANTDGTLSEVANAPAQCVIISDSLTGTTNSRTQTYRVRYVIDDNGRNTADGTMINGEEATIGVKLPLTADNAEGSLPLIAVAQASDDPMLNLRSAVNTSSPKTAIDLLWQRNSNTATTPAQPTGYVVEYSTDDGVTWKTLTNADGPSDLGTNTIYTHSGVVPGKKYTYRVFPWHRSAYGLPKTIEASSEPADEPAPVRNLRVTAVGEEALRLDWVQPTHYGGHKEILGYLVQVSADDDNDMDNDNAKSTADADWVSQSVTPTIVATTNDPTTTDADKTTYTYRGVTGTDVLSAGSLRWFRVIAITLENDGLGNTGGDELSDNYSGRQEDSPLDADISAATEEDGITDAIDDPSATPADQKPGMPIGLTAEPSHSINLIARTDRGVLLLWNEPEQTPQTKVTSYVIERQVVGTDTTWQAEGSVTFTGDDDIKKRTSYVDTENPEPNEVRMYRVGSKNIAGTTWSDPAVMYPATHAETHMIELGAPMNVMTESTVARELAFTWDSAENAEYYILVAVDLTKWQAGELDYETASATAGDTTGKVSNLTSGTPYLGIVFSARGTGTSVELMSALAENGAETAD